MERWLRVKELFHEALERPPAERPAFLTGACGDAADLRVEVERLLAAHAEAGEFIERSPTAMAGRVIGHYRIERALGAGGMGEVYLARDLDLGRTVAIKIAIGSDAGAHVRLKREAQHASQLNHPHICTIHEVGTSDAQPFIVMEFVEGHRLADLIPAHGLPAADVRRYGGQIAAALAHAHRHGVIHRDLKTSNVVVTPDGRAKVLDFGLARLSADTLKGLSQSRQSVTADDTVAGTLSSIAPEVLRGGVADARSDIWALGVLLYEMAAGTRPFAGTNGFELSGAILHETPAPLPETIPAEIRDLVTRCLEKDPGKRIQHADAVRLALEASPAPAAAARVPLVVPTSARPSWRRWQPLAALMLGIILVYGSYRVLHPDEATVAVGASGRPAIAVLHFENAGGQDAEWMSKGIPSMLLTGLAQTRGLDIVSTRRLREAAKQKGADDIASVEESVAADIARQAGAGAIVTGSIYKAGAEIRIDARVEDLGSGRILAAQSVRGTDVFGLVDQLAARIRAGVGLPDDPHIRHVADVSTSSLDAFRLYSQGVEAFVNARADAARIALEEAVRIDPAFAEAYLQLASVDGFSGHPAQRREHLRKAAENADRLSEPRRLFLNIQLARDAGNLPEAARRLDELITKFPETEAAYTTAGLVFGGELRDTRKLLQMMKLGVSALPASPSIRNDYGYALLEAGEYGEGIRQFEKYVELSPREANPYDSLADGHLTSGSPAKAIEFYSRALSINPGFQPSRVGLAWSLAVAGRYDEALAARSPLALQEGFLLSRVGRYGEAAKVFDSGRRQAEGDQNATDQTLYILTSAALALEQRHYLEALRELSTAETAIARQPESLQRRQRVLHHVLSGLAELGAGRRDAVRRRLPATRNLYRPAVEEETFWYRALEGELALANGEPAAASAAFAQGEPAWRKPMRWQSGSATLLASSLPFRDGAARAAKARGDFRGAIQIYRRLLTYDAESKFIAAFEPRYVLELARLLEKSGDTRQALQEYERFLVLWHRADPELPELAEARRAVARLRTPASG